jgi:MGT family glycosyltransferase
VSKIVFITPPAHGHINPTLPLVQELVQRGEQVVLYNTEEFRQRVERTGAEFRPYPSSEISVQAFATTLGDGYLSSFAAMVLRATETLLPFMLDELEREKPDLVMYDSLALWGKMAANLLNLPQGATISHFVFDLRAIGMTGGELLTMLRQYLPKLPALFGARRRLMRQYGKGYPRMQPLFPMRGDLNIVFTARELNPDPSLIDETFHFVGPSINPQLRDENFPFDSLKPGKLVYISLGTVHGAQTDFFRRCLEAFADYPAQFILSTGGQTLENVPPNFIARPTVPQLEVLERADAFITHGGINSIQEALYYSVPLIVIPQQFEQLLNARVVKSKGAGIVLEGQMKGDAITAADLRQSLESILAAPAYRESAIAVQKILHATGGYRQAADEIQTYLAHHPLRTQ